jgi:hypothetical protein
MGIEKILRVQQFEGLAALRTKLANWIWKLVQKFHPENLGKKN